MGFWKDVDMDMQRGMSKEKAIELNAALRYGNLSKEEKQRIEQKAEWDLKIDRML